MLTNLLSHAFIWSGALLAGLCGAALLAWALFADRSRGRRRCGRCWYSMDHAASLRCPECGHEAKNDRALYRTRRRWKWAAVSLLLLLPAAFLSLGVQPKVQQDGWGSIVPATVMILLLRIDDRQWVLDGIQYHITETHAHPALGTPMYVPADQRLWRWQWRVLARSVLTRIEDESRSSQRTTYHSWLLASADAGGDAALRQKCMDALVRELAHSDGNVRRSAALYSINYEDIDGSIERAIELLNHEDARTRVVGVRSLGLIALRTTGKAVPALIDALRHEDAEVRSHALSAIGATARYNRPVPEAFDPVDALAHDEDGDVRYRRIMTLADLQSDEEAWNTIDAALHHDDPHVRRGGLAAAARHPRPSHVSLRMIECLGDPDATVRREAALMLDLIDAELLRAHAELLQPFLSHDDPNVRSAAERALQQIRQMGHP